MTLDDWLGYLRAGYSVIPIKEGTKAPLIDWKPYQARRADQEEVERWLTSWPDAQLAVVTGEVSGVVVLDFDADAARAPLDLPAAPMSTTGRGVHLWFKHPGHSVPNKVKLRPGIDVRGDGGYVLVPPSLHPSGKAYAWSVPLRREALPDLPDWVNGAEPAYVSAARGVGEGKRNDSAASVAGRILASLPPSLWDSAGWGGLQAWNLQNRPPLPDKELRATFDSIRAREHSKLATHAPVIYLASERLSLPRPEIQWIVERILPEGVTLLAGKPKKGKSWLAQAVALSVARGMSLWTPRQTLGTMADDLRFSARQGSVLYLALEDGEGRFLGRLDALAPGYNGASLHYTFTWPRLANGGMTMLTEMVERIANLRLVVIDTLVQVRQAGRGARDVYQEDTEDIRGLKSLVLEYPIGVLLVHHLRKAESDDPGDMVSGSTGLLAAVDTYWVLRPQAGEDWTQLYINGRDVPELDLAIKRTPERPRWELIDARADQYRAKQQQRGVLEVLLGATEPLSPRAIADEVGQSSNRVRQTLLRLVKQGKVDRTPDGDYTVRSGGSA